MRQRSLNRAARALTAVAAAVVVGALGFGGAYASEVPASEEPEAAVAEEVVEVEVVEVAETLVPAPETAPDATPTSPEAMPVAPETAQGATEEADEADEADSAGVLPTQFIVDPPPPVVWSLGLTDTVTISIVNNGEAGAFRWYLDRVGVGRVASDDVQVPAGAEAFTLYDGALEVGEYHFWTQNMGVENGDFTFAVRQIQLESLDWVENPVEANPVTGVADGVLTGVLVGHEADGVRATVSLVGENLELQSANGDETPLAIDVDGSFQHTFVGLEPGTYKAKVNLYYGDLWTWEYTEDALEVTSAGYEPAIAQAAFNPVEASVCPGEKVGSTLTGKVDNWNPDYKVAVEFFADYDLDNDDFELLEEDLDVEVAADGTFSYTIQPVGVGDYSADITVYTGDWEDEMWVDIQGFVPFTVTQKDCTVPDDKTPDDKTPVTPDKKPTTKTTTHVYYRTTLPKTGASVAGLLAFLGVGLVGTGSATLAWRRRV